MNKLNKDIDLSVFKSQILKALSKLGLANPQRKPGTSAENKPADAGRGKRRAPITIKASKLEGSRLKIVNTDFIEAKDRLVLVKGFKDLVNNHDDLKYILMRHHRKDGVKSSIFLITTRSLVRLPATYELRQKLAINGYSCELVCAERNQIDMIYHQLQKREQAKPHNALINESRYEEDFDKLLEEAMARNISDIHIEVRKETAVIRFRENGSLIDFNNYSVSYAMNLIRVIYTVMAEEKQPSFTPRWPQDAVADRHINNNSLRVRIATIPTYPDSIDMVLRLLPLGVDREVLSLDELGYWDDHVKLMRRAAQRPSGCFIISGSTGSGKSTTLKHIIGAKVDEYEGAIKIITVEDPPEYQMYNVSQSPVVRSTDDSDKESAFAKAIRASLRCDPDILMVGEVRDQETANLLITAVLSGHQALTTVHASSSTGIIQRLVGMGVPQEVVGSGDFVGVLVNQALVPHLCKHCAIAAKDIDFTQSEVFLEMAERIGRILPAGMTLATSPIMFRNKNGCGNCSGSGVSGRKVVAEVLLPNEEIRSIFASGDIAKSRIYWLTQLDGITLLEDGIRKMMAGYFDPFNLEHKAGALDEVLEIRELRNRYHRENADSTMTSDLVDA